MPSAAVLEYILSNYLSHTRLPDGSLRNTPEYLNQKVRTQNSWKPTMPFFSFLSVVFSFHDLYVFGRCNVQSRDGDETQLWLCLHAREGGRTVGGGVVHLFVWSQRAVTSPYLVRWRESASLGISLKGKRSHNAHNASFATFLQCFILCLLCQYLHADG